MLTLNDIYKKYNNKKDCIIALEKALWNSIPKCPYCSNYRHYTELPKENRYHCNVCKCSFSVTVQTMFHKTKIDLQKWFYTILHNNKSVRQLAREIGVTKDTASYMIKRIKLAPESIIYKIKSINY